MKPTQPSLLIMTLAAMLAAGLGGCAKKPRILITPFVLKASEPPDPYRGDAPEGLSPATVSYERAVLENCQE